jgi:hypothetical protein
VRVATVCCSSAVTTRNGSNMTRKPTKQKIKNAKSILEALGPEVFTASVGVWSGRIARLRVYVSTKKVFAYKAPGRNADFIGSTDDPNTIHALFLGRDNGRSMLGYTDDNNNIVWLDY